MRHWVDKGFAVFGNMGMSLASFSMDGLGNFNVLGWITGLTAAILTLTMALNGYVDYEIKKEELRKLRLENENYRGDRATEEGEQRPVDNGQA